MWISRKEYNDIMEKLREVASCMKYLRETNGELLGRISSLETFIRSLPEHKKRVTKKEEHGKTKLEPTLPPGKRVIDYSMYGHLCGPELDAQRNQQGR